MLKKVWKFISNFFSQKKNISPSKTKDGLYVFKIAENHLPEKLEPKILYILKEDGVPWEAVMICPCGCGAKLELNLLPDERPLWGYKINRKGLPTLYPSVNRKIGCRSHFFLRQGKIIWAESYD